MIFDEDYEDDDWDDEEEFLLVKNDDGVKSALCRTEPDLEEDGLPSKEWLLEELMFYEGLSMEQEAKLVYHLEFEKELILSLWGKKELGRLGNNGAFN